MGHNLPVFCQHRPQQDISLLCWTGLSGLRKMPVSQYSVHIWTRYPPSPPTILPWEHKGLCIPQSNAEVVHRPLAIFGYKGSKSITEGRYWDGWIRTSGDRGVTAHIYLSASPVSRSNTFSCLSFFCAWLRARPVAIEISLNLKYFRWHTCHLFGILSQGGGELSQRSKLLVKKNSARVERSLLPAFPQKDVTDGIEAPCSQYVWYPACNFSL